MSQNLIIPEIFADCVNEKLGVALKLGQCAVDYTSAVPDITTCGSKVNFPTFDRVASVGEVTKGTALTLGEVTMSGNEADIVQIGGGLFVYDKEAYSIKGQVLENMTSQISDAMAKDFDTRLGKTMDDKATKKSPCASAVAITATELSNAFMLFGDNVDFSRFSNAGIVISSKLLPSFYAMDEFTSVERTYMTQGNGLIQNGLVGYFRGVPVRLSDNPTWDSTAKECKTYIIANGSLGYVKQQDVNIEIEREAKLLRNNIIASELIATNVMDKDGIVIIRKTVA